jgi:hypothetical protein
MGCEYEAYRFTTHAASRLKNDRAFSSRPVETSSPFEPFLRKTRARRGVRLFVQTFLQSHVRRARASSAFRRRGKFQIERTSRLDGPFNSSVSMFQRSKDVPFLTEFFTVYGPGKHDSVDKLGC